MYLNKTQLIERGWSAKLVKDFLGAPARIEPLGRYCEEHLYFLPRVENVEQQEDFREAQAQYRARRTAGRRAAETQTARRIEAARTMVVRVRRLPADEVLDEAIFYYNARNRGRRYDDDYYDAPPASTASDARFLERITVNYIRHELTSYDAKLFAQRGKIGGDRSVPIIRRRVFDAIICAYPHLERECDRQMLERGLITQTEIENKYKPLYEQLELPFRSR